MKYIKLFENFEDYDPYELMIIPPGKKAEMIIREIMKKDKANLNLVNDLIALGADLEWQDKEDGDALTALHRCAFNNHSKIARMLIDAGADLNIQDNDGWTALHWCADMNLPEIARMLIDAGADVNIQHNDGWTALYVSAYRNHPEITRMLIGAGADVNIQHNGGYTALHWCAYRNRPEIAKMLLDAGADKTIPSNDGKLPYEVTKSKELKDLLKP